MSTLAHRSDSPFLRINWQADALALTDEAHLAAWSASMARRIGFATEMAQFIQAQGHTEICQLYGRSIANIEAFCQQLERAIPGPPLARRIDGPRGITALLRSRDALHGGQPARYRYLLWHDADVLLEANRRLFSALLDAIMGVAAEAEYVSDELLLLHRAVLIGGPALARYAEDPAGQLQSWLPDSFDAPFWKLVTGVERPPVVTFEIDHLGKREEPRSAGIRGSQSA